VRPKTPHFSAFDKPRILALKDLEKNNYLTVARRYPCVIITGKGEADLATRKPVFTTRAPEFGFNFCCFSQACSSSACAKR
jgi:hypothetical protein